MARACSDRPQAPPPEVDTALAAAQLNLVRDAGRPIESADVALALKQHTAARPASPCGHRPSYDEYVDRCGWASPCDDWEGSYRQHRHMVEWAMLVDVARRRGELGRLVYDHGHNIPLGALGETVVCRDWDEPSTVTICLPDGR